MSPACSGMPLSLTFAAAVTIHGIHGYVWLEAEPNEIQMPSELLSFIDSSIEFGHGGARLEG